MTGTTNSVSDTSFRESEHFRAECEARFWLAQYRRRESLEGRAAARAWWNETVQRITKIRGQRGIDYLRDNMNRVDRATRSQKGP
jgi:hypothetical protein